MKSLQLIINCYFIFLNENGRYHCHINDTMIIKNKQTTKFSHLFLNLIEENKKVMVLFFLAFSWSLVYQDGCIIGMVLSRLEFNQLVVGEKNHYCYFCLICCNSIKDPLIDLTTNHIFNDATIKCRIWTWQCIPNPHDSSWCIFNQSNVIYNHEQSLLSSFLHHIAL